MIIEEKLIICQRRNYLSLIEEGIFLRAYNQSAYILTQYYYNDLKVMNNMIKKLNNRKIVFCAFPKKQIMKRLSNVHKTEWGYELRGDFDLSNYKNWFQHKLSLESDFPYKKNIKTQNFNQNSNHLEVGEIISKQQLNKSMNDNLLNSVPHNIQLTQQQLNFLKNWQKGKCLPIFMENFIESIRQQLWEC